MGAMIAGALIIYTLALLACCLMMALLSVPRLIERCVRRLVRCFTTK